MPILVNKVVVDLDVSSGEPKSNYSIISNRRVIPVEKTKPLLSSLGLLCLNLLNKILSTKCPNVNKAIFFNIGGVQYLL